MKKLLTATLLSATLFTAASAHANDLAENSGMNDRQVIQNLESAQSEIRSTLAYIGRTGNVLVIQKLNKTLDKIEDSLELLQGGVRAGRGGGQ